MSENAHERMLNELLLKMVEHDGGDPELVQHFIKVAGFARVICTGEGLDGDVALTTVAAATVHDIGIRHAREKCGHSTGKLQEELGPEPARRMMLEVGFEPERAERVAWLVGHHHTYDNIDGIDYQELVEADFLVNLQEHGSDLQTVRSTGQKIFRTKTGTWLLKTIFGL